MNAADRKKLQTDLWRESALLVGERLRDNGPMDYYKMTALEWRDWALETAVSRNRAEAAEARCAALEQIQQDIIDGALHDVSERCAKAETRCSELEALFALQQTRMAEATRAWQTATGKRNVLPDLGDLLAWLMDRPVALEAQVRGLRELETILAKVHRLAHDRPTKDILPIIHQITEPWHRVALAEPQEGNHE